MATSKSRGSKRITEHIETLGHPGINVACRAEGYLVRYYGVRAVVPLIEACSHTNPQVRFKAARALGRIGDRTAIETLLRLTEDPDPSFDMTPLGRSDY